MEEQIKPDTVEQAKDQIEEYIFVKGYTWTFEGIKEAYLTYSNGEYVSHTAKDVINNCIIPIMKGEYKEKWLKDQSNSPEIPNTSNNSSSSVEQAETIKEQEFFNTVEQYINSLEWDDCITSFEKALVAGNIRSFAQYLQDKPDWFQLAKEFVKGVRKGERLQKEYAAGKIQKIIEKYKHVPALAIQKIKEELK